MKVYSLYYKDTFVAAFPNREDAVGYGEEKYWMVGCNILEEYWEKPND
jgi:hypothetical protein